jgi:hypothetical protein
MNDRARAIALLQQARDILAERLTERLLESRDAILEDALGLSYSSEIDAVQEQIGQRLNHVNVLLNNLPPIEEVEPQPDDLEPAQSAVLGYEPSAQVPSVPVPAAAEFDAATEFSVAPPVIYVSAEAEAMAGPSLQDFVHTAMTNDVEAAGRTLAKLLDVSPERGRECAQRFRDQLREQPQFLQKAMNLRHELAAGSPNGALLLLWECFGLQGVESLAALQTLKARMNTTVPTA